MRLEQGRGPVGHGEGGGVGEDHDGEQDEGTLDVLAAEHAGQHFHDGDLGLHVLGGLGKVHMLAGDFKDDLFRFFQPAAGHEPAGGFLEVAQADEEGDEADAAEVEDEAPRFLGEGDDCAAHDADDRHGGETHGGHEVLPLAA